MVGITHCFRKRIYSKSFERLRKLTCGNTIRIGPNEEFRNSLKMNFTIRHKRIRTFRNEEKWLPGL